MTEQRVEFDKDSAYLWAVFLTNETGIWHGAEETEDGAYVVRVPDMLFCADGKPLTIGDTVHYSGGAKRVWKIKGIKFSFTLSELEVSMVDTADDNHVQTLTVKTCGVFTHI